MADASDRPKPRARRRRIPPVAAGLKGQCPACGEGKLFAGLLKFHDECEACGADFRDENTGDGPAFFAMFAVLIVIIPMALGFQMITHAPMWLVLAIWGPIIIGVSLFLLRMLRGVMFNIAWQRHAREIRANEIKQ